MDHHHGDKSGKFNSADELDDFKSLFSHGITDSALSRNLSEDIWNEYKNKFDEAEDKMRRAARDDANLRK